MYGVSAQDDEKVLEWQWRLYQHSDDTQRRWIVWLKYGVLYVCAMYTLQKSSRPSDRATDLGWQPLAVYFILNESHGFSSVTSTWSEKPVFRLMDDFFFVLLAKTLLTIEF